MDFLNVQPVYMASSIKELGEQAKLPPFDQKIKVELYGKDDFRLKLIYV